MLIRATEKFNCLSASIYANFNVEENFFVFNYPSFLYN